MKSLVVKLSTAVLLISFSVSAHCKDLLASVATNLRSARSSPTIGSVKCPANLDSLAGLPSKAVVSKLGRADVDEIGTDEHGQALSVQQYIFANSSAKWIRIGVSVGGWSVVTPLGTPFTVMIFTYNKSGQLLRAQCYENRARA
jgi:hypothetical protein